MMKKIRMLALGLLMASLGFAQPAQKDVTGKVTDNSGQPLSGVTILNQNSKESAVSGNDGAYRIKARQGDVLVFSNVSFTEATRTVGAGNVISLSLQSAAAQLSDVVVVG